MSNTCRVRLLMSRPHPDQALFRQFSLVCAVAVLSTPFARAQSPQALLQARAAQLCDYLFVVAPEHSEVKRFKADALEALAGIRLTTTARNYYRTAAQGLRGEAAASAQEP